MVYLTFSDTSSWTDSCGFGCASLGLEAKMYSKDSGSAIWSTPLDGIVFSGTYTQVLEQIAEIRSTIQAAVILFGNAGGENVFMSSIRQLLSCPMVGGGAAIDSITGKSALITGGGEVAVLLITDNRFKFTAQTRNIHSKIIEDCDLTLSDPRTLLAINGVDAAKFLADYKEKLGICKNDFEHLTLCDEHGINAHLSCTDGVIKSGRDLAPKMHLRYVDHKDVYDQIRAFYSDPHSLVFGCAGLGGLLDDKLNTDSLGLFLFGEVCTVDGFADFGNLMLSKLCIQNK